MISIRLLPNIRAALWVLTAVLGVVSLALGSTGHAQAGPPSPPPPQIITQGRGEIDVIPDRGELIVQVETRAVDGGQAGAANAAAIAAVLDTLKRGFRLVDRDLATIGYNLHPQMVYPGDGKAPRVVGFVATNSVRIRTEQVARIGAMIDASIKKGATGVAGLTFYSANIDDARRRALAMAVENARRDGEAMAAASGGRLGALIEMSSEPTEIHRPMPRQLMMEMKAAAADTPIQAGEQKITASVTARWRFISP